MNTIIIGRTRYKTDRPDILALHAKCTGKHKIIKPKAAKRAYPKFFTSTADYVAQYFALNTGRNSVYAYQPGGHADLYEPLNDAPAAYYTETDTMEICE